MGVSRRAKEAASIRRVLTGDMLIHVLRPALSKKLSRFPFFSFPTKTNDCAIEKPFFPSLLPSRCLFSAGTLYFLILSRE